MANYVKFKTNLGEKIIFRFNEPKVFDNKFKEGEKVYSYGVEWQGGDAYLNATPILHDKLQALSPLEGKILEITKVEGDNNRKYWVIKDHLGNEITPQTQQNYQPAIPAQNLAPNATQEQIEAIDANIRKGFAERDSKIKALEERVKWLEEYAWNTKGQEPYVPLKEDAVESDSVDVKTIPCAIYCKFCKP